MEETMVRRIGRLVGIGLYLAVGFFYLASGLVVPVFPWLIILIILWVVGLVVAWRASAQRWWIALMSGPIAWIFWIVYVSVGEALLGWSA
jgi:hypothetical protein